MMRTAILCSAALAVSAAEYSCPGPAFGVHARCEVTATVNGTCANAMDEVTARLNGEGGWVDPHNAGNYSLIKRSTSEINAQRFTGKAPHYHDLFNLEFKSSKTNECEIAACSRSQTSSVLDASTNYCNLHNLYCGSNLGCKYVRYNFAATEKVGSCVQHETSACLA